MTSHEIDIQDVEYLRHGDKPLLAKVYKPRGEGPFPALVDLHGGAWCLADRNTDKVRHEVLAGHGAMISGDGQIATVDGVHGWS